AVTRPPGSPRPDSRSREGHRPRAARARAVSRRPSRGRHGRDRHASPRESPPESPPEWDASRPPCRGSRPSHPRRPWSPRTQVSRVTVALHGLGERAGQVLAGGRQMRMDREGGPEEPGGLTMLTERHVTETLPGEGAEVVRLAGQCFPAILDGGFELPHHVAHGGALVPRLGEIGSEGDETVEDRRGRA